PYYLQAFFFLLGTFCWLISEAVFKVKLPFWTELWGWSLVLTNFFSLPLMNTVGLFLEESEERDYLGILSFVILSYILVPFQAYASLKGFLKTEESPWFRTPKTGRITDIFKRGRFYRWLGRIWGGKVSPSIHNKPNFLLLTTTANNNFINFRIKKKYWRGFTALILCFLVISSSVIFSLLPEVPQNKISPVQAKSKITIGREINKEGIGGLTKENQPFDNSLKPKLTVNEHNPKTHPQDFYLDLEKIAEIESLEELEEEGGLLKTTNNLNEVKQRIKSRMTRQIKRLKPQVKEDNNEPEKDFLPYYYLKTKENYQLFLKSEKGIQRYIFDKNSLVFKLSEKENDKPDFIDKALSKPIFQYKNNMGEWEDYIEEVPLHFNLEEFDNYLLLTASFGLFAQGVTSLAVPGEINFKLGFDGNNYFNKLSFKIKENSNINRLIWENQLWTPKQECKKQTAIMSDEILALECKDVVIDWRDFPFLGKDNKEIEIVEKDGVTTVNLNFLPKGQAGNLLIDPTLSTTVAASTVTITSSNSPSWKAQWDGAEGYLLEELYIPYNSSTNILYWQIGVVGQYVSRDYYVSYDNNCTMEILEMTESRVVMRSKTDLLDSTRTYDNGDIEQIWIVYPDKIFIKTYAKTITTAGYDVKLTVDGFDSANVGATQYMYDDDSTPTQVDIDSNPWWVTLPSGYTYNRIGLVAYYGSYNLITNVVSTSGLGTLDRYIETYSAGAQRGRGFGDNASSSTLDTGDSWIISFEITEDASGGTIPRARARDYWNPDDLSDNIGSGTSGWFDSDENTASSTDFFNEEEGVYCLQGTMGDTQFAQWDIDGATYNRYHPSFKLRGWRKYTEPSLVTLEGSNLTDGTDYNLDIAPFSEAWIYDSDGSGYKKLADGGDNADSDEYLNDDTNNWNFGDSTYTFGDSNTDYFYLGSHDQFTGVNLNLSTVGAGTADVIWEYCSANSDINNACDTWSTLTITDTDSGANDLKSSGNFYFSDPSLWVKATVNSGRTLWWIRGHLNSGSYTTYPTESTIKTDILLLQYLGNITSNDQTFVIVPENLWGWLFFMPFYFIITNKNKNKNQLRHRLPEREKSGDFYF
ncbi:MAG: hypothetical protein NC935_06170, partial [Candidatus Omnitrophica bacterium]|nr:hypothetical protein [Candidatus Omnitrophota bacterium]